MKRKAIFVMQVMVLFASVPVSAEVIYNVIDLGILPGHQYCYAWGINNSGQIVGMSYEYGDYIGFLYEAGTMNGLSFSGNAAAINEQGQIAGSDSDNTIPILYDNGTITYLSTLSGTNGNARDINSTGQIAGSIYGWTNYPYNQWMHAVLWENGETIDLQSLPGGSSFTRSFARGINDAGQIVGGGLAGNNQAFLCENGTMIILEGLQDAWDINNSGQIVGQAFGQATLYEDGLITTLGVPGQARAINDSGLIVGEDQGVGLGFVYDNGVITHLPPLDGYVSSEAFGINDTGQIVGLARANDGTHAVLWEPVPEPATLLLLGFGSVLIRRKGSFFGKPKR